ncbi:MAG: hypothetical protein ACLGQX_12285 [Acidobacteriota bacterium]
MISRHKSTFNASFRSNAFGWRGSQLACQRLKGAVTEIRKAAKTDPVAAADSAVWLMERIWPAFQRIDTSSGALGAAVCWALEQLAPLVIAAPADRNTRDAWLDRLREAIEVDGVEYLSPVGDHWGELCGSAEVASLWADRFLSRVRMAWSDPRPGCYVRGSNICLSSLLAAGRHQELLDVLALRRFPSWFDRRFGVKALVSQGRVDEALAYAEASRGLNQPDSAIDAACEEILLAAGRTRQAYERYALTANQSTTGLATFRAIQRKYPERASREVLADLAAASGEPGRWFAAAKDAGLLDLALEFARSGRTDPRTLSRASRDLLDKDPNFSLQAGRWAIQRILQGDGYEITVLDAIDACRHLLAAAQVLGVASQVRTELFAFAEDHPGELSSILIRQLSADAMGH